MTYTSTIPTIYSPANIAFLIHCYADGSRDENFDWQSDDTVINETADQFLTNGLVFWREKDRRYITTNKGAKLMKMLCDTPLPVSIWEDPRQLDQGKQVFFSYPYENK